MKYYTLYGHDGSANHGCEALVRTTAKLLEYENNRITLVSAKPDEDRFYGIGDVCNVVKRGDKGTPGKNDPGFFKAYFALKLRHDYSLMDKLAEAVNAGVKKGSVALAIGGDSYCYHQSLRDELIRQHDLFRSVGIKTVFWGCSIDPELLNDKTVADDMRGFDLITARESISYEALKKVNPNTILVCDSAFELDKIELPLPEGFEGSEIVGINTSPLIERREASKGIARRNYEELIERILDGTDYKVMLIPHVKWKNNDDTTVHCELYEKFKNTGRIAAIEDHNCMELKGYIARCRFFIGARTHATIAAYSTGVPTLVVGYSTKAIGIARDLFGTDEGYVLPVQSLSEPSDLADRWEWLHDKGDSIRSVLEKTMPEYKSRICKGQQAVKSLS